MTASDGDPNPLITLLRECVVRIDDTAGRHWGSGFFLSPGRVATCAHVVRKAAGPLVSWRDLPSVGLLVSWRGLPSIAATVAGVEPSFDSAAGRDHYPLPDLAVIDLDASAAAWGHPCVRLAAGSPAPDGLGSVLYLAGYTDEYEAGVPVLTGVSTEFESEVREGTHTLYKLKRGQVSFGYSGSPLLDLGVGAVAGITEASRGVGTDLGGFAVPVAELTAAFPDVADANQEFHHQDRRWEAALEAHRVGIADRKGQRDRLGLKPAMLPSPRADSEISPALLLSPRFPIVGYVGRERLLEDLATWRERPVADAAPVGLWFVTASGGYGKTRLAVQACVEAEPLGWTTGLLRSMDASDASDDSIRALADWPGRLLLVIDDAEVRPRFVARLISQFAVRTARPPVRILLLVRRRAERKELLALFNEEREEELATLLDRAQVCHLEEDRAEVDRAELFRRASAAFAAWSASGAGANVSVQGSAEPLPSLRAPHFARPLYVLAAAYLHLNRQPAGTDADALGETDLLRALLEDHEALHWRRIAKKRDLPLEKEDQRNAVAVATLLTAEGDEEALAVARLIPHLADVSEPGLMAVARWLADLYPAASTGSRKLRIAPLEPDRLGEVLVADVLGRYPDLLPAAFDAGSDRQLAHALMVVTGAAVDSSAVRDQLRHALDERLVDLYVRGLGASSTEPGRVNPELFNAVVVAMLMSRPTTGAIAVDEMLNLALPSWLQDHAIGVVQLAVEGLRELASRDPAREPELVSALSRLSFRLSMTGRWEEAAERASEAVRRCRELVTDHPGSFQRPLAVSLIGLVGVQRKLRHRAETEEQADESVELCRALAAADPAGWLAHLAASLRNLAWVLSGGPRQAEGLAAAQEAVSIDRGLSAADPLNHLPSLAESLAALAVAHHKAGQPTSAADAAEEAVTTFRSLSGTRGDAYLPELAESLCILGNAQRETGQPDHALSTVSEAVAILRQLTGDNNVPSGYRAALARSLKALAAALDETGRLEEALDSWQEAAGIYRPLAIAKPDVYRPDLASALAGLGTTRWRARQLEGALTVADEAMSIHRSIAETRPEDYRPERARLLTHLAVYLADAGIADEALSIAREAVHEYRQLAAVSAAYRSDLAAALTNLAGFLDEAGHTDEAVRPATEAVGLYEARSDSIRFADMPMLARSLQSLANLLLAAGRSDEAVDQGQRAVDLLRLAADRSRGELPGLAASLLTLAACLNSVGRAEESLQAAHEAVGLYRELATDAPRAHAERLAEALGIRASLLGDVGRHHEAENLFAENLDHFAEAPDVVGPILLARGRWCMSCGDLSAAIDDLDGAVRVARATGDRSTRGQARRYLRHLRERDSSSFDRAWEERQRVPLPVWLSYLTDDDQLTGDVSNWARIRVPAKSRMYLEGHAGLLLSDEAEAALEHLIDVNPGTGLLENQLELLRAARADGIGNAYGDLTRQVLERERQVLEREKREILEAWLSQGSWQASRDFAVAHASDLVHPVTVTYFDRSCAEHPEIPSFRLHRGYLHFAAEAPDAAAGFRDAYDLGRDAGRLMAALTASDPLLPGRTRLALARMYSGNHASEPEAHFLLATVLLGGEEPGEEGSGPRAQSGPETPVEPAVVPVPEYLAEARVVLADCAGNAAPYERDDFARRLAAFTARRPGLEPHAVEFQRILTEQPGSGADPSDGS